VLEGRTLPHDTGSRPQFLVSRTLRLSDAAYAGFERSQRFRSDVQRFDDLPRMGMDRGEVPRDLGQRIGIAVAPVLLDASLQRRQGPHLRFSARSNVP
jgi:hypothetical protein